MHDRLPLPQPDLDWSSTGPLLVRETPRPGKKGYWEIEKVFDLPRPVPQPVELVGYSLDRLSLFGPENLFFLIHFFSNT